MEFCGGKRCLPSKYARSCSRTSCGDLGKTWCAVEEEELEEEEVEEEEETEMEVAGKGTACIGRCSGQRPWQDLRYLHFSQGGAIVPFHSVCFMSSVLLRCVLVAGWSCRCGRARWPARAGSGAEGSTGLDTKHTAHVLCHDTYGCGR